MELAFVLILLLIIVAGIVEFGRAFWYYNALAKATRDGARFMSTAPKATINSAGVPAARNLALAAANAANLKPALTSGEVTVTCLPSACTDGTAPENVRVAISYGVTIGGMIPFFLPTGGGVTAFTAALAPHTTMRYMLQ